MNTEDPRSLISRGGAYLKAHPQLFMTVFLAVFIPVAFLVSGQQFLSAARDNQERLEMDRVGMMHDLMTSFARAVLFDGARLQQELELLTTHNPDITKFRVAREEGIDIRIIAASDPTLVGTIVTAPEPYRIGNTNPNEAIITPYAHEGTRYWQSFKLIREVGFPDHYLFIETSLAHVDTLFAARIMTAYYWLVGLLFVILFLLFRHIRLIDYAYLYSEMKRANEMKDLFTNMIAHELRAPLTAMRGYASMIRERSVHEPQTLKEVTEIERAAGRLVVIVSDLLDVARIQSGKMTLEKSSVHLLGVLRSVIESLAPSAHEKHIKLTIDDANGSLTVNTDEKRLYQALTNVVSNAIKYTEKGSITLSLTDMRDRVEIRVKDTGMGISADNQQKLFAPFFRVDDAKVSTITGTGLGMWITKQLIELMGGSIGIESIKGVGTHVVITLPKL